MHNQKVTQDICKAVMSLAVAVLPLALTSCVGRQVLEESKSVVGKISQAHSEVTPRAETLTVAEVPTSESIGPTEPVKKVKVEAEKKGFDIWLVKPIGEKLDLVAVNRAEGTRDNLREAVEELLRGPDNQEVARGLSTEIPKGSVLLGMEHSDDSIILNVSRRFASDPGTSSIEIRLDQLRRTVAGLSGNKKVYLDVEGERLVTAGGEGLEIKQPIN